MILHCAERDSEALADFLVGEVLKVAEGEDLPAAGRELADGFGDDVAKVGVKDAADYGIAVGRPAVPYD